MAHSSTSTEMKGIAEVHGSVIYFLKHKESRQEQGIIAVVVGMLRRSGKETLKGKVALSVISCF